MYPTENNTHSGEAEFEERNDGKPPHVVIMMPDTPPQSILKPKSNAFWTKKRIVCVVVAILVLIGCGVGGAIWYFYPREKESTSTSSSMHATPEKKSSSLTATSPGSLHETPKSLDKPKKTDVQANLNTVPASLLANSSLSAGVTLTHNDPTLAERRSSGAAKSGDEEAEVAIVGQIAKAKEALEAACVRTVLLFGGTIKLPGVVNVDSKTKPDSITGDFNEPDFVNQMAKAFSQKFDIITFEYPAFEHFNYNKKILSSIHGMLKQDGRFICQNKEVSHLKLTAAKFECAAFDEMFICRKRGSSFNEEQKQMLQNVKQKLVQGVESLTFGGIKTDSGISVNIKGDFGDKSGKMIIADFNDPAFMTMMQSELQDSFSSISITTEETKRADYTINFFAAIRQMLKHDGTFKCPLRKGDDEKDIKWRLKTAGFSVNEDDGGLLCKKSAEVAREDKIAADKRGLTKVKPDEKTVLRFGGVTKEAGVFGVVNMFHAATTSGGKSVDAIIGNFNDEDEMGQMAEAFPQKFDYIMFDGSTAEHFNGNVDILKLLRKMLKKSGKFIYEMKDGADIGAITADLGTAEFDIVKHIPRFDYRDCKEPMFKCWKFQPKSSYNVLKCSNCKEQIADAKAALNRMEDKSLTIGGTPAKSGISVITNKSGDKSGKMIIVDFNAPSFMKMMKSEFADSFESIYIPPDAESDVAFTDDFLSAIYAMLNHDIYGKLEIRRKHSKTSLEEDLKRAGFTNVWWDEDERRYVCKSHNWARDLLHDAWRKDGETWGGVPGDAGSPGCRREGGRHECGREHPARRM